MPISQDHRALFRCPGTTDKLNLLQSLADAKDLTSIQALALIHIIRAELEQPQKQSASAYRRYSEVIRSLRVQMPDIHEQVVNLWQQRQQASSAMPTTESEEREPPGEGTE
jgi:hypothetical protein